MGARLRFLLLTTGLVCLGAMSLQAFGDDAHALPGWAALAAAGLVTSIGILLATSGWVALAEGGAPAGPLRGGFLAAQLGKYIPGGVWAGVGQLGFGVGAGLSAGCATGALAAYGVILLAAAGTVAALTAPWAVAMPAPWIPITALALPLLLVRGWLVQLVRVLAAILPSRLPVPVIPGQVPILSCFIWLVPSMLCLAVGFAIVLRATGLELPMTSILPAFCVAWLAGFLAFGLPSGLGAREAVLVMMLDSGVGVVVAASVTHRLMQGAVEVLLLLSCRRYVPDSSPVASTVALPATRRSS